VIVVRSCSPIAVSVVEHLTLGRELPSLAGICSLLMIAGGAAIYAFGGEGIQVDGIAWLAVYFVFIVTEMVFVKFVVDTVPMSTWTRVYYNNALSIPLALLSDIMQGDTSFLKVEWTPGAVIAVSLSCVVGVAISYAGFNLRKLVSATSFTVVGVVCKLVTVLINDLIWTHHSNAVGHIGLLVCIAAGFCYERSKRK
jgi:GDP-mannose transporter